MYAAGLGNVKLVEYLLFLYTHAQEETSSRTYDRTYQERLRVKRAYRNVQYGGSSSSAAPKKYHHSTEDDEEAELVEKLRKKSPIIMRL